MKRLIVLLVVTSCTSPVVSLDDERSVETIYYIQDKRTNICFACLNNINSSGGSVSFTEVDCEKVKKLIKE